MNEIGFTGTRQGMTLDQMVAVHDILIDQKIGAFHQGLCKGSDIQAATIAASLGWHIHGYPAANSQWGELTFPVHEIHPLMPALKRDQLIVDASHLMIATPKLKKEEKRSGTWYTIRYARKQRKPVYIVWPNGKIKVVQYTSSGFVG